MSTERLRTLTAVDLAHLIRDDKRILPQGPRFALFLGAGASVESGILRADAMVRAFRHELEERTAQERGPDNSLDDWIRRQPTYDPDASEYSNIFQLFEPSAVGRQRYIEQLVDGKEPSFGYFGLAQLIQQERVNTVVTTNFDDLVYLACSRWTDVRPMVYAYGAPAGELRLASRRTKILKLHGDYLYSRLKNTVLEVGSPDPNLSRHVRTLLQEYEIVVVGYGGHDQSILQLLEDVPEGSGLYWCVLKGHAPSPPVRDLLRRKQGLVVEIEGFDRFMDEVLRTVGFQFPDVEEEARRRRDRLIETLKAAQSPNLAYYLGQAAQTIEAETGRPGARQSAQAGLRDARALLELSSAHSAHQAGRVEKALEHYSSALELSPEDPATLRNRGIVLWTLGRYEESLADLARSLALRADDPDTLHTRGIVLRTLGRYDEAEAVFNRWLELRPDDPDAFVERGLTAHRAGSQALANTDLRRAADLFSVKHPAGVGSSLNFVTALVGAGDPEQARARLRSTIGQFPGYPALMTEAIEDLKLLGDLAGAQDCIGMLEEALETDRRAGSRRARSPGRR